MLISLIFCFLNSEVKSEINKIIERKVLEYDPLKQRRVSRFLSNKIVKKSSILSHQQTERLNKTIEQNEDDLSPKSFYKNSTPRLTISTYNTDKSRESSVFFPNNKRKSNGSNLNQNEFKQKNNTSINNLNSIVKLNDENNTAVEKINAKNHKKKSELSASSFSLMNLFKRETKTKSKAKTKSKGHLTKVDSIKIIKAYLNNKEKMNDTAEAAAAVDDIVSENENTNQTIEEYSKNRNLIFTKSVNYYSIHDCEEASHFNKDENFSVEKEDLTCDATIQQMA